MKKILATILAFIYLSTSMGATLHLHYCMDKLVSWGFIDHESKNCGFCGMAKKDSRQQALSGNKSCCKDEHKQVKIEKDQKLVQSESALIKHFSGDNTENNLAYPEFRSPSFIIKQTSDNAPPRSEKIPLFLFHKNFRI